MSLAPAAGLHEPIGGLVYETEPASASSTLFPAIHGVLLLSHRFMPQDRAATTS